MIPFLYLEGGLNGQSGQPAPQHPLFFIIDLFQFFSR
jgi:hypothetical protein